MSDVQEFFSQGQAPGEEPVPPIVVRVNGEEFMAGGVAPADLIVKTAQIAGSIDTTTDEMKIKPTDIIVLSDFLDAALMPESRVRFAERMKDPEKPIDIFAMANVVAYLIGKYTAGKDQPTSLPNSSASSSTDGAPSTATAQASA